MDRPSDVHEPTWRWFRFRFAAPYRVAAVPFLVTPATAGVAIETTGEGRVLRAHFGPWQVETPVTNVVAAEITGPYSPVKTIGPPHLSLADHGLTFATNGDRGVCIRFARPVRGIDPLGMIRHPGLTVTVDDPEGLLDLLSSSVA